MAGRQSLAGSTHRGPAPRRADDAVLRSLASGDERMFEQLVDEWSSTMLRLALARVESPAVAEEIVQDAWLTALGRLDTFEGRSSLRTWVLGIVVNLARARARSERRAQALLRVDAQDAVAGDRFRPPDAAQWPQHWALGPVPWPTPEQELLTSEARDVMLRAIELLPPAQREVLVMRDVQGCPSTEACTVLGITDTNQRVLLHRARSRVRQALEDYFDATEPT